MVAYYMTEKSNGMETIPYDPNLKVNKILNKMNTAILGLNLYYDQFIVFGDIQKNKIYFTLYFEERYQEDISIISFLHGLSVLWACNYNLTIEWKNIKVLKDLINEGLSNKVFRRV